MDNFLLLTVGSCFIFVGVATGAFFIYRIYQAAASNRWPFVLGELESSELKQIVLEGRDADGSANLAAAWVVNFSYDYTVANAQYRGKRVTYSDGINKTRRALRKLQDKYRGKSTIQVYYNPGNPRQSVLVPGLSLYNFTPLITSSLFVAFGLFWFQFTV